MYKFVIIALLATATCGFPATGVDDSRPELDSLNLLKLKEDLTPVMAKPKRAVCVGVISVCREESGGLQNITHNLLESGRTNLKTAVDGMVNLAAILAKGGNN